MFGKKLKNTGFQPYGGLEMRYFEKTGEKRLMVSGKRKTLLFPSYCLSLSFKFKESPACRRKKGRIDRWQEGRTDGRKEGRGNYLVLYSLWTLTILPRSNITKCVPKSKHLIPLLSKEKESHSNISIRKISIYQIKRSKKNKTAEALSDYLEYLSFFSFWTCTIMKGRH